ncbi:MAG: hypothetical protein JWO92_1647 [Chitinophagaceae bacterium]|nr:hypothetical protein [Chitinophagaceae bacterium]
MPRFYCQDCQMSKLTIMKKYFNTFFTAALALISSFLLSGCVKDSCHRTYTYAYYNPVYKTTAEVKANIKSNPATEIQNPGKIYILGNYIFLNEIDKGIHIIDNSNPSSPVNKAFITIPGNMDMAVKGNILYADLYTDLVTIDISNPLNAVVKKYNEGAFPYRSYGYGFTADRTKIIIDWVKRDTTIIEDCGASPVWAQNAGGLFLSNAGSANGSAPASPIGLGGSMARFTLINNFLYAVDDVYLNIFNISNSSSPSFSNKVQVDWHVETIYPFKNNLFVGSNNGMYIYDIQSSPANPVKVGQFIHARACDPVIADDNFAYVTLHSGTDCMGFNNQLDIVSLNNLTNAALAKTYNLTSPRGLSKDGKLLFICDGTAGLKIYDASDVMNLQLIKQIALPETYDVIAYNNIALVVAKDGLYQYDYSNINNIHLMNKIGISK